MLESSVLLLAIVLAGCGVGAATDDEKVSKTATTYLRALGDATRPRRARG